MLYTSDSGEHPGAVLRQLRYTGGRRLSQRALATLLGTSRAHIARLELHGSPPLTDEQLDRLEKAGDTVRPPFSRAEIDELRVAMRTVRSTTVEQANKAVEDIATRAGLGQIFPTTDRAAEQGDEDTPLDNPFSDSNRRPKFLTDISKAMESAREDIKYLAWERRTGQRSGASADPDMIMTYFGQRNPVEEAEDPEKFRDAIREVLRGDGTAEHLLAPPSEGASQDLIAVVPQMISYLGQGGPRYRAHVIDESRHPLAYGICIAGGRGLLITRGGGRTVAVRTNNPDDVAALHDLLRPYWKDKKPIIEDVGRRTRETVVGYSPEPSVALPFEQLLTAVEVEEGPRRLFKEGLSILNIPIAIHAWKWRAAELCTAGWIPLDLLGVLHTQAWDLAAHGLGQLPPAVLDKYPSGGRVRTALQALEEYAVGLQARHAAWGDQLTRHQFWDACPKSALTDFITDGELPPDEIPPACEYRAERGDIETIITRLITRLRSSRNYHLALIDDPRPFPQWFYFGVKGAHVLAQVFGSPPSADRAERPAGSGNDMLNVHIDYAPIAAAFAGWFDDYVLKAADPPWQDNHAVANWLEEELGKLRSPS
jgi:transcriptional regulator with XRE-family HTH domain